MYDDKATEHECPASSGKPPGSDVSAPEPSQLRLGRHRRGAHAREGRALFEVYNGRRYVRDLGDATHASTERMWDIINTAG